MAGIVANSDNAAATGQKERIEAELIENPAKTVRSAFSSL
jgi:hypothetical protein